MMRISTGSRMREIDSTAINVRGIPGIDLMERAGEGLTASILEKMDEREGTCVIVCGAGNNGGDGYVAARLLMDKNRSAKLYSVVDPAKLGGDAAINRDRFTAMGGAIHRITDAEDRISFREDCANASVVVDGIFGTGISREVGGLAKEVIDIINEESGYVIAVDIPSGVGADNGLIYGTAVKADRTVTFQMNKYGMVAQPGRSMAGEVVVKDIQLPADLCAEDKGVVYAADAEYIAEMLPERSVTMNKGSAGKVLIVAGSKGMAGAAVLAAKAAYRSGAGLVKVAAVWEVIQVIQVAVPEATCLVLGKNAAENKDMIKKEADNYDAVVVGPGLGKDDETAELVEFIVENIEGPVVLDADGINIVAENPEILKRAAGEIVMTPHPGEMGRLIRKSAGEVNADRLAVAEQFAKEYNVVLLLKGAGTLIACPSGKTYINMTGNSAMATGGSGDVLSGITGALMASGLSAEDSAVAGAYVHGMSGDICREYVGDRATMAMDLAEYAGEAFRILEMCME